MRIATITTPNTPELEALSGLEIATYENRLTAAERLLRARGCRAVLAKGGHFPGMEIDSLDLGTRERRRYSADDLLYDDLFSLADDGSVLQVGVVHERLNTRNTHGTGCTMATAIAVGLGWGYELDRCVREAARYVQAALRSAPGLGAGHGPIGHALGEIPFEIIHKK
jgi:hydroxymethylpyrimidine/phosphomethylpyrimidine kinase